MKRVKKQIATLEDKVLGKIVVVRKERMMLDVHLAELYNVETRSLKQAVKRNIERFPKDFMIRLTDREVNSLVTQNVIPHKKYFGGASPFAFTENGIAMLSSVLNSDTAVIMNITIMRTFTALRKLSSNYKQIVQLIEELKKEYDAQFERIFFTLDQLIQKSPPPRIGFRRKDEE
jgi:hypothetical protein